MLFVLNEDDTINNKTLIRYIGLLHNKNSVP